MLQNHWFLKVFERSRAPGAFQENEKPVEKWQFFVEKATTKRSKQGTSEPLDMRGKYDAYMFGLGGPKNENVEKPLVLNVF